MSTVQPTPHLAARRVGDDDRQRVIDVLADQHAKGVLPQEEFEERLGGAITAQTTGELGRLIVDLPLRREPPVEQNVRRRGIRRPRISPRAWRITGVVALLAAVSYSIAVGIALDPDAASTSGAGAVILGILIGRLSARRKGPR